MLISVEVRRSRVVRRAQKGYVEFARLTTRLRQVLQEQEQEQGFPSRKWASPALVLL